MNRFLQKEWEAWEPDPDSCQRARDGAWERHCVADTRPDPVLRWIWPVAVAATLLLAVWVMLPSKPVPFPLQTELTDLPLTPTRNRVSVALPPATLKELAAPSPPIPAAEPLAEPGMAENKLDRVVLQFRLPGSGVRMIWIQDRKFGLN